MDTKGCVECVETVGELAKQWPVGWVRGRHYYRGNPGCNGMVNQLLLLAAKTEIVKMTVAVDHHGCRGLNLPVAGGTLGRVNHWAESFRDNGAFSQI